MALRGHFCGRGRGRWYRRWGFALVNTNSTGFLQSPNVLAPASSPFSVPHFPGGLWSGLPNLSWVTPKGSQQAWTEVLKALAFSPSPLPQAWLTFRCQLLPLQPVPTAPRGSTPVPSAGGEREAGPRLATPAGTDALTYDCVTGSLDWLTGRVPSGISRCFVANSHLVLCPGLCSA